ncbi:MAG: glycosyltransferase family 9 protein [Candidatus Moraniibacteriota bacterium]
MKFFTDCKEWVGYKPCREQLVSSTDACYKCKHYQPVKKNILIIEAGGLGSVLRTTVLLREIKGADKSTKVQWLTNKKGMELLRNIPYVSAIYDIEDWRSQTMLQGQYFDLIFNFESSPLALATAGILKAGSRRGFILDKTGNLTLASKHTEKLLQLQTNDRFRKRLNKKSMQQLLLESVGFEWKKQTYCILPDQKDDEWAEHFLSSLGKQFPESNPKFVGLNIGSSLKQRAKRWPVENFYQLAHSFQKEYPEWQFIVLAGPEDRDVYSVIRERRTIQNLHFLGWNNPMSKFISLVNKISIVVSADTFGMHLAIGLGKRVISLHGPQPDREIFLYGRGKKIKISLECSPCFNYRNPLCSLECMSGITVQTVKKVLEKEVSAFSKE